MINLLLSIISVYIIFAHFIRISMTTQCPKDQVQKEKQRTTKHTHKTKDRETRTPLKTGGEPKHLF
jgi:hypothetical protein